MHGHSRKEKPPISCAYAHSVCVVRVKKTKEKTLNEKKQKKTKKKLNPLTCQSRIFYI
jgi:hypothetical protein